MLAVRSSPAGATAVRACLARAAAPSRSPSDMRAKPAHACAAPRSASDSTGDWPARSSSRSASRTCPWASRACPRQIRTGPSVPGSWRPSSSRRQAARASGIRPGEHQAAGPFGKQLVPARITRRHQPGCPPHQVSGDIRRSRRGLPGGPGQPGDGLGVARPGPAGQLLGHLQRRCLRSRQPLPGLMVQPAADAGRQVLVEGITDQVVAEPETGTVVFQHPCRDRCRQGLEELQRGPGHRHRQVGNREAGTQDGGGPERVQRVIGQEAQAAQDRQPQGGRQDRLRHFGLAAGGLDQPLLGQRRRASR